MVDYSCDTCINQHADKCNHCMIEEYHGQRIGTPTNYEQIHDDDAISREDALKLIYDFKEKHTEDREKHPINYGTLLDLIWLIRELPSVTQKSGKWIVYNYPAHECVYCSNCKTEYYEDDLYLGGSEFPKFCPNCGASMADMR